MNYLIPLMVVIPILAALIVNIFGGKDKAVKAISIVVAIAIPLIAVIAAVGIQYFGGHDPTLLANALPSNLAGTLAASYNTGIVYVFENIERIAKVLSIEAYLLFKFDDTHNKLPLRVDMHRVSKYHINKN